MGCGNWCWDQGDEVAILSAQRVGGNRPNLVKMSTQPVFYLAMTSTVQRSHFSPTPVCTILSKASSLSLTLDSPRPSPHSRCVDFSASVPRHHLNLAPWLLVKGSWNRSNFHRTCPNPVRVDLIELSSPGRESLASKVWYLEITMSQCSVAESLWEQRLQLLQNIPQYQVSRGHIFGSSETAYIVWVEYSRCRGRASRTKDPSSLS